MAGFDSRILVRNTLGVSTSGNPEVADARLLEISFLAHGDRKITIGAGQGRFEGREGADDTIEGSDEVPTSPRTVEVRLGVSKPFGPPVTPATDAAAAAALGSIHLTSAGGTPSMSAFVDRTKAVWTTPSPSGTPILPPDDEWVLSDAGVSDESRIFGLSYSVVLTRPS